MEESRFYTRKDIQKIMGLSEEKTYRLLQQRLFHWIRIGKGFYRISKKSFDAWLDTDPTWE